jgi:lipopolysaccharide export LptBFGC system permease protein LptF
MAKQNKEKQAAQAIAVINNLIIPDLKKYKLKTIARKIYQSIELTQEEATFWNSFPNSEKFYILTGDTAQTLDFTEYQRSGFCSENHTEEILEQENHYCEEPNLFFKPSSSDSDSSEDPDYIPPVPLKKIISTSDDSWPNNSNSALYNQPSTSKQHTTRHNSPSLESNSSTESLETETAPPTPTRVRLKNKNNIDSWKNTATTL